MISVQRFARVAHIPVSIETWVAGKQVKDVGTMYGVLKVLVEDVVKHGRK